MYKYFFLLPLLLVFTFSCNASATKSLSLVVPFSATNSATSTSTISRAGSDDNIEFDTNYTGVGFRYEEKDDSIGLGVEFTPSANYSLGDGVTSEYLSGPEIGVLARKYFTGMHLWSFMADNMMFIEAGAMLGLGLSPNLTEDLSESSSYANLKLAVGLRTNLSETSFAELSAGHLRSLSPSNIDIDGVEHENSIRGFGVNLGFGMNF
jgi:hypothetical protein